MGLVSLEKSGISHLARLPKTIKSSTSVPFLEFLRGQKSQSMSVHVFAVFWV
jgi:hypothetical protein